MILGNITLSIPDDVHAWMREHPDIRWSEVARQAIVEKLLMLREADEIAKGSKLTQKDVDAISRKIKKGAHKRFMDDLRNRR
jgi:hypothetical protein